MDKNKEYEGYVNDYKSKKVQIESLKKVLTEQFDTIILWGAGLKGMAFLECFDEQNQWIDFVVDSNEEKQGTYLDTGHPIRDIESVSEDMVIIITNEKFYDSICISLIMKRYRVSKIKLLCIEAYLDERISLDDIKSGKVWKRRKYYD